MINTDTYRMLLKKSESCKSSIAIELLAEVDLLRKYVTGLVRAGFRNGLDGSESIIPTEDWQAINKIATEYARKHHLPPVPVVDD